MNICSAYFGHHDRGCWKRLVYFLNCLAEEGNKITLITSEPVGNGELSSGIRLIRVPVPFSEKSVMGIFFFTLIKMLIVMFSSILNRYERFIAFDCHNAIGFSFLSKIFNSKTILYIRGLYIHQDRFLTKLNFKKNIFFHLNRLAYRNADWVRFTSNKNMEDSLELFGVPDNEYLIVRNNILNLPKTGNYIEPDRFHNDEMHLVIGFLGQLTERKNVKFLIDLIKQIDEPNVKLLIQGRGELKHPLVRYAKELGVDEKVTFLDWSNNTDLFFNNIDVFILPSLYDDSPNSLIEAISYDKIVFSSSNGGAVEILGKNSELTFCPFNDMHKLKDEIIKITRDKAHRDLLVERVKECKSNLTFDWYSAMKESSFVFGESDGTN